MTGSVAMSPDGSLPDLAPALRGNATQPRFAYPRDGGRLDALAGLRLLTVNGTVSRRVWIEGVAENLPCR